MKRTTLLLIFLQLSYAYHLHFFIPLNDEDMIFDDSELGMAYAHGLTIAIDDVNSNSTILPGHTLTYNWTDSTMHGDASLRKVVSQNNESIDVFIGPATECKTPAKIAEALNIPMISYHCSEEGPFVKQDYPLFIQTYQNTISQISSALLSLLRHEDWKRIGVIYEEENKYWTHFRDIILERSDIHVAKVMEVPKVNKFNRYGEYFLEFPEMEQRNQSLAKLRYVLTDMAHKEKIKVFVLLTSFDVLIEIMAEAYDLGLTSIHGQHQTFIGFQLDAKTRRKSYIRYPEMFYSHQAEPTFEVMIRAKKAARSLLIISVEQPVNTDRYERFREKLVNRTEHDEPFKFSSIYDVKTGQTDISDTACFLYDAVYQYALALNRLHERNATITPKHVVEEFRSHPYEGMNGYASAFLKKDGILKSHLSLLYLTKDVTKENVHKVHPEKIGKFRYSNNSMINLELDNETFSWSWRTTDQLPAGEMLIHADNGSKYNPILWLICLCMVVHF